MQVVEFTLPANVWLGLNTRYPADTKQVDADQFTDGSFNFLTDKKGVVTKRPGGVFYNTTALTATPKDQYEAIFSSGVRHLLVMEGGRLSFSSGGGTFTTVTSGYSSTGNMEFASYKDRVYFGNGVDNPQSYDKTTSYGGVTYSGPKTKQMGALAPSSAPSVSLASDSTTGQIPAGVHSYKVTYLYYDSEESNGSTASGSVTNDSSHTSSTVTIPVGDYGVTARKVYRDDDDGAYKLVQTISDNTTTSVTDIAALGTLPIPTDNGLPPTFGLVIQHRDRLWMAGVTSDPTRLYWSEAGLPDIVMTNNNLPCNPKDPITALVVYNDTVVVFNRNSMGQILGLTSDQFRYVEVSPNAGCIDNRSIQIRTVGGVPTLMWLSGTNFYEYNGSSINPVSAEIDDQLQLNIQQASQVKGKNTQTTSADFTGGTSSPGIDLTSVPGVITTKGYTGTTNPTKAFDTETEWENGSSLTNIATHDGSNTLKVVTAHSPTFASGTHNNTVEDSGLLKIPVSADSTGESHASIGTTTGAANTPSTASGAANEMATRIMQATSGTITSISIPAKVNVGGTSALTWTVRLYSDDNAVPGSLLQSTNITVPVGSNQSFTFNPTVSWALNGGTFYWISVCGPANNANALLGSVNYAFINAPGFSGNSLSVARDNAVPQKGTTPWEVLSDSFSNNSYVFAMSYVYARTAVSGSGVWIGPTYDSFSDSAVSASITHTGSFPSGCSSVTTVEAADDDAFTSNFTSEVFNSLNGSSATSLTDRRYWRIRIHLTTTDDRSTPSIGLPTLKYDTTGTWVSEVLDHTTDITSLDALTMVSNTSSGSATVTISTSSDDSTYSSYTAVGSATAERYSKVKVVLTTDADNAVSASVSSVRLNWSLEANLVSSAIDTGSTPAGWELFQATSSLNSGTVLFEMRTAASSGDLASASWTTVTNGAFITADVFQWAQWRVTITSHADEVPTVSDVTLNWLIQNVASVRIASLFYNKQYFLAAAEFGQTANNIVFMFGEDSTWKVFRGLGVNTFGQFFNDAYYGSSTVGKLVKWLDASNTTDQGTNIELDLRTKAFSHELGDETKSKMLRSLTLKLLGTGATLTPSYSLDAGNTWNGLVNPDTGLASVETSPDNHLAVYRFVPSSATTAMGRTIMLRLHNNDEWPVQVHSMRAKVWISARDVTNG